RNEQNVSKIGTFLHYFLLHILEFVFQFIFFLSRERFQLFIQSKYCECTHMRVIGCCILEGRPPYNLAHLDIVSEGRNLLLRTVTARLNLKLLFYSSINGDQLLHPKR
ncbi:unnamed protein product, partial [Prunus brigantina]